MSNMKSLLQSCSRCSDSGHKPYLKLWQAVLLGALRDLQGYPPSAFDCERHQRAAQRWFKSHGTGIGNLNWVCEMTSLDADTVRRYALGTVPRDNAPGHHRGRRGNIKIRAMRTTTTVTSASTCWYVMWPTLRTTG